MAHGVMHCDLKPSNILFDPASGRARITDFGNARKPPPASEALYDFHGTIDYLAPECLFAEPLVADFPADVWSLGVVFLGMLARRRGLFTSFPEPPPRYRTQTMQRVPKHIAAARNTTSDTRRAFF